MAYFSQYEHQVYNKSIVKEVSASSHDEKRLKDLIHNTLPQISITKIKNVNNIYLTQAYKIKNAEIKLCNRQNFKVEEELLHATSQSNVKPILENNLNWRLVKRSKYGKGVSFTKDARYANKYCNNRNGSLRAFIVCDVLVNNVKHIRDNNDTHPPNGINTYISNNRKVIVKFEDFTFNPKYVIYYSSQYNESPLDYQLKNQNQDNRQNYTIRRNTTVTPGGSRVLPQNYNRVINEQREIIISQQTPMPRETEYRSNVPICKLQKTQRHYYHGESQLPVLHSQQSPNESFCCIL